MCSGQKIPRDLAESVDDCANKCRGVSKMFMFGTDDFGYHSTCESGRCLCYCESDSEPEGSCTIDDYDGFRQYEFTIYDYGKYYKMRIPGI